MTARPDGTSFFDLRLLQHYGADEIAQDALPARRLLAAGTSFSLWQEETPREGMKAVRRRHLTRDHVGRH